MNTENIAHTMAELGNATRLEIFRLLVRAGPDGLTIGEIGKRLGIPASTLGFHIRGLVSVELITQEKQGRSVICRPGLKTITTVIQELVAECCVDMDVTISSTEKEDA
ncbi:MAG: helix-turn-helix domain-containing protein [Sneathiella sp.]